MTLLAEAGADEGANSAGNMEVDDYVRSNQMLK